MFFACLRRDGRSERGEQTKSFQYFTTLQLELSDSNELLHRLKMSFVRKTVMEEIGLICGLKSISQKKPRRHNFPADANQTLIEFFPASPSVCLSPFSQQRNEINSVHLSSTSSLIYCRLHAETSKTKIKCLQFPPVLDKSRTTYEA